MNRRVITSPNPVNHEKIQKYWKFITKNKSKTHIEFRNINSIEHLDF